ncbi:MAG: hypothetical protein DMG57_09235 [Acidobacteria bacterium]|nr:MAG: hypothetical protein DMG57_09235 [Acidobacteriota bacterium]
MSQFLVFLYPEEAGWPFLGPGSNIPNGGKWCILEAGQDAKNIRWFGGCGMWEDSRYCWVVICKNHWFHVRQNIFFGHRIPLAETDAVATLPALEGPFVVRCDECGKEYHYKPSDVRRYEQDLPESFTPHPLFREDGGSNLVAGGSS